MSMQCVNCVRTVAVGLDAARPGDDHRVRVAAQVAGHLLAPLERGVVGVRPRGGEVRGGVEAAQLLDAAVLLDDLQLLVGVEHDAVEEGRLVERAGERALHAGAVVAPDVDDQRVVEVAHLLDRVEQAADVPVGVLREAGEDLHLAGVELLLRRRSANPRPGTGRGARSVRCPAGRCRASSGARGSARGTRPSPRRTCPCTCRPTPWRRGAGRGCSRWSST